MSTVPPLRHGVTWQPSDTAPRCPAVTFDEDGATRCSSLANPAHDWHSGSGLTVELDDDGLPEVVAYGVAWRVLPALEAATRSPCCSAHGVPMTCARYRRTHFVEVRPCCAADAARLGGAS